MVITKGITKGTSFAFSPFQHWNLCTDSLFNEELLEEYYRLQWHKHCSVSYQFCSATQVINNTLCYLPLLGISRSHSVQEPMCYLPNSAYTLMNQKWQSVISYSNSLFYPSCWPIYLPEVWGRLLKISAVQKDSLAKDRQNVFLFYFFFMVLLMQ